MGNFEIIIEDCLKMEKIEDVKVAGAFYQAVKIVANKMKMDEVMFARQVRKTQELRDYIKSVAVKCA
jgi:hypothetical protein